MKDRSTSFNQNVQYFVFLLDTSMFLLAIYHKIQQCLAQISSLLDIYWKTISFYGVRKVTGPIWVVEKPMTTG